MMATKWYTKNAQFKLPAWQAMAYYLDGLYINDDLFYNNIPVQDMVVWISVQPDTWHIVQHQIAFDIASYNHSTHKVEFLHKLFAWAIGHSEPKSDKIFCNGNPYGMGLNPFWSSIEIYGLPIANPIIYDVSFIMEVKV
jgi:hypothetical protein